MGWFTRLLGVFLVGILSTTLAVIFQNDIAAWFGRAPVTAEITVGAWFPRAENASELQSAMARDSILQFSDDTDIRFARIIITNRSGQPIENVFFATENQHTEYLRLVSITLGIDQKINDSIFQTGSNRVSLGSIPPASSITTYVWSNQTFGYPFDLSDFRIITNQGDAITSVNRLSGDSASYLFGIHNESIAWTLAVIAICIGAILILIINHDTKYIKWLMKSEDYYLSERIRHDGDPEKFNTPAELPTDSS